ARRQRQAIYEGMRTELIDLLSQPQVRRLGDALDQVDSFARERRYDKAAAALDEAYYRYPKADYKNSASAVLDTLGKLKDYPEAEYWIGEVYYTEGELDLALAQYQKALDLSALSEQKSFRTDILYKIAGVYKIKQNYNDMERVLLQILEKDTLWSSGDVADISVKTSQIAAQNAFARNAMTKTLETEGIDRFLSLYRYDNTEVEQAHRLLGLYYYASGRHSRAQEHLMYAFLIQNSVIISELIHNEFDYSFNGLDELFTRIARYPAITGYIDSVDYYKTAYYLGCGLYGNGKTAAARSMWSFLQACAPAGEWQNRSRSQLGSPRLDPAIQMP
ncbi:MAG: hypothetical protein FWF29_07810, partial [Treponema sp.]|nr:hypothetical protein [Treponema sp.]